MRKKELEQVVEDLSVVLENQSEDLEFKQMQVDMLVARIEKLKKTVQFKTELTAMSLLLIAGLYVLEFLV